MCSRNRYFNGSQPRVCIKIYHPRPTYKKTNTTCKAINIDVLIQHPLLAAEEFLTVVECENKQNDKLKSPNLITQDQDPVAANISTNNSSTTVDTVASSTSLSDLNSTTSLSAALHEDSAPTSKSQTKNYFVVENDPALWLVNDDLVAYFSRNIRT
ncbi:hypothetical protein FQA39_LY02624 [Lamprigera yunnana]|nr:hypothetical protein FQA39_LY02624 [Lamprigera yunnana]